MNAKKNSPQQASPARDELAWEALRYVAGEMSSAEAAAFEGRMEEEQAVREAVSQAVALGEAILRAAEPAQRAPSERLAAAPQPSWSQALGWMAAGALAASLTFVAFGFFREPPPSGGSATAGGASSIRSEDLSLAWSALSASGWTSPTEFETVPADRAWQGPRVAFENLDTIPTWLLAGVATSPVP